MMLNTFNIVTFIKDAPDLVKILAVGADYQLSQDERGSATQVINQVLVSQVEPTILDVVEHLQTVPHLELFAKAIRRSFLP